MRFVKYKDGCLEFIGLVKEEHSDYLLMAASCLFNGNIFRQNLVVRKTYYSEVEASENDKQILYNSEINNRKW